VLASAIPKKLANREKEMALVNCEYCAAQISDQAPVCIECGAPVKTKASTLPSDSTRSTATRPKPLPETSSTVVLQPTQKPTVKATNSKNLSPRATIIGLSWGIFVIVVLARLSYPDLFTSNAESNPDIAKLKPLYRSIVDAESTLTNTSKKFVADVQESTRPGVSASRKRELNADMENLANQLDELDTAVKQLQVPATQNDYTEGVSRVALITLQNWTSLSRGKAKSIISEDPNEIRYFTGTDFRFDNKEFDKYLHNLNICLGVTTEQMMR
jgi:hypothetical protein